MTADGGHCTPIRNATSIALARREDLRALVHWEQPFYCSNWLQRGATGLQGYREEKRPSVKTHDASLFIQSNYFINKISKFVTILKEKITDILSLLVIE